MTEVWATIPGWEGYYEVSTHGRVRSVDRVVTRGRHTMTLKSKVLKQAVDEQGYSCVALCRDGKPRTHCVYRLVIRTFKGERPEGMEACHANDVKTDNRLENLRWATKAENMADKRKNNRQPRKLNREIALEMLRLREEGLTYSEIAERLGCSTMGAYKVINRMTYALEA